MATGRPRAAWKTAGERSGKGLWTWRTSGRSRSSSARSRRAAKGFQGVESGSGREPPEPLPPDLVAPALEGEDLVAAFLEEAPLRLEHHVLAARRPGAVVVVGHGDAQPPPSPARRDPGHASTGQAAPMRPGSSESA